jgi:hypothetical protein
MTLLFWLFTKHFIVDFPMQAHPYMYTNKGTYGHPGGILHAGLHALATFWVVLSCCDSVTLAMLSMVVDGVAHYHIDWAKMNVGAHYGLLPNNSEWFWILLGFDQYLHALTYFFLAWVLV